MDEHSLGCVADSGPLRFGIHNDLTRHFEIGVLIHIDNANTVRVFNHRHAGVVHDGFDQRMAAAWNDKIDEAIHFRHETNCFAIGLRDKLDTVRWQSGFGAAALQGFGDGDVGMNRFRAAAKNHGIACFRTKNCSVAGDVRPRLVNDADDPDRHAHFGNLDSVRLGPGAQHFPDRIGQAGDLTNTVGHFCQAFLSQGEAIDHRADEFVFARALQILCVRR